MYLECDISLLPLCMDYNWPEHSQGSQGRRRHRRGRPAAGAVSCRPASRSTGRRVRGRLGRPHAGEPADAGLLQHALHGSHDHALSLAGNLLAAGASGKAAVPIKQERQDSDRSSTSTRRGAEYLMMPT